MIDLVYTIEELFFYLLGPALISACIAYWVYWDAKYKVFKERPILWALATFFLPFLVIMYLLYRKK